MDPLLEEKLLAVTVVSVVEEQEEEANNVVDDIFETVHVVLNPLQQKRKLTSTTVLSSQWY